MRLVGVSNEAKLRYFLDRLSNVCEDSAAGDYAKGIVAWMFALFGEAGLVACLRTVCGAALLWTPVNATVQSDFLKLI